MECTFECSKERFSSALEDSFPRAHSRNNNASLCLSYMLGPSARNFCRGNLERLEVRDPSKAFRGQDVVSVTRLSL